MHCNANSSKTKHLEKLRFSPHVLLEVSDCWKKNKLVSGKFLARWFLILAHHELLCESLTLVRLQSEMKVHLKHPLNKKRWERDCVFSGGSRNQVQSPSKAFLKPFLVFQSENRYDKCNKGPGGRVKSSHGRVPLRVRTSPGHVNNFTTSGLPVLYERRVLKYF